MSTHEAKVIKIESINKHPDADRLELIKIWDYTCVVGKGQFKVGDLAVFIEPDTIVDTSRPEFNFLAKKVDKGEGVVETIYGKKRITVARFRGVWSSGLLIEAPKGFKEGDDAWTHLGLERWEPGETKLVKGGGGSLGSSTPEKGPEFHCPYFDLENLRKYGKVLSSNDEVLLTAKLHGSQGKFVYSNGRMYCGSRNMWKKEPGYYFCNKSKSKLIQAFFITIAMLFSKGNAEKVFNWVTNLPIRKLRQYNQKLTYFVSENAWWKAYYQNPWIKEFCEANPDVVLYGEVYGPSIQGKDYHYGMKPEQVGFAVFDVLENGKWIGNEELHFNSRFDNVKKVPLLYKGKYYINIVEDLAEKKESFNDAGHVREGIVVKLVNERTDERLGRVALKYVSNSYLSKG